MLDPERLDPLHLSDCAAESGPAFVPSARLTSTR
jgi:hypothetical protein